MPQRGAALLLLNPKTNKLLIFIHWSTEDFPESRLKIIDRPPMNANCTQAGGHDFKHADSNLPMVLA
jgi:hypothetical protein